MEKIPALHIRLEGLTASFRYPLVISGTQTSVSVPPYSTLLGMISACAGRIVKHTDTRIGFEFHCKSHDLELERKDRWELKGGKLKPLTKKKAPKDLRLHLRTGKDGTVVFLEEVPQGIGYRQIYWYPQLDLYLTNLDLQSAFENPATTPCFGRSHDIAWITFVRRVYLHPVLKGALGPTLIPMPQPGVPSLVVRVPEWVTNSRMGYVREPGPFGIYQAIAPSTDTRYEIERDNLYHPSDAERENDVIYLHEWLEE